MYGLKGLTEAKPQVGMKTILLSTLFMLAIPGFGFAQTEPTTEDTLRFKKVTLVSFGDLAVSADVIKPEGSVLVARRASRFASLIRTRQTFRDELVRSLDSL